MEQCLKCNCAISTIKYLGTPLCEECHIGVKIAENYVRNGELEDNTFTVTKGDKKYTGSILGYQHMTYKSGDKYYIHLNVNERDFSIWYDGWKTEGELVKICDRYKINKTKLLE